MTSATKNAIMATAALEGAEVKAAAIVEQASNNTKNADTNLEEARKKREAAENALTEAQKQRTMFEDKAKTEGDKWLELRAQYQAKANQTLGELVKTGMTLEEATSYRAYAANNLAKFEEEHKTQIEALNEVVKLEQQASTNVEAAKREEQTALNALKVAM